MKGGLISMAKIKDRDTLSIVSGLIGFSGLILVDIASRRIGVSKKSYREAAAGVFVSKNEAKSLRGQALGLIMTAGVSIMGANVIIKRMSQNGRDKLLSKGHWRCIKIISVCQEGILIVSIK